VPTKRYILALTADEREQVGSLVKIEKRSARTITRARVLLLADQSEHGPNWEDRRVAEALGCGHRTVERIHGPGRETDTPSPRILAPWHCGIRFISRRFGNVLDATRRHGTLCCGCFG